MYTTPIATDPTASLPATGDPDQLRTFLDDSVGCLAQMHRQHGRLVQFNDGRSPAYFVFDPEFNREVLTRNDLFYLSSGFPGPRRSAQRRFSHGLFGLNGEKHQQHRRLLMPPFRKEAIESYRDLLVELTEGFVSRWREGHVVDMAHEMKELALLVTSKLLFGIDDLDTAHGIAVLFDDWMDLNHEIHFVAALPIVGRDGQYEKMLAAAERLEVHIQELIREREALEPSDDVMSILLAARTAGMLTEAELVGHLHTLFNASYHTTTSALTWTMLLLALHPSQSHQMLDEFDDVLGGAAPTVSQLPRLGHLDRVIKESLRILPPVVYAPRINMAPTRLGDYELPSGSMVVTSQYVTHHLPELFPQPEKFLPERWLTSNPSPYAYFPFGAGPRMCIGAPFANLMLKLCVSIICQQFRMTVEPGTRIDRRSTLTLGPAGAIPVSLRRQDRRFVTSPIEGNLCESVDLPRRATETRRAA